MGFENPALRRPRIAYIASITSWAIGAFPLIHAPPRAQAPGDSLTLAQALERGGRHPALEASARDVRATRAAAAQAGAFANPRLSLEAENFAGTGPLSGAAALETTARLEQTIELGGKRSLRRELARAETRGADAHFRLRRREIFLSIRQHFAEVLRLQEKSRLLEDKIRFLETSAQLAQRRSKGGAGSLAEELKVSVELSLARLEGEQTVGKILSARRRLSSAMGATDAKSAAEPLFVGASGDLRRRDSLPSWEAVRQSLESHPDLLRWKAEQETRKNAWKLADAENVPDLDLNAGFRRQRDASRAEYAWVGGVSIPLPLWNRNRGAGAAHRVAGAAEEERAARVELEARARALWDGLRARAAEIDRLGADLIPGAEKANAAGQAAFAAGRGGALELLDGQRLLFELKERHLEALAAYHHDAAELEMLAGALTPDGKE